MHKTSWINIFMKKKVAVLLCGLCNINPKNIDGIFGAFKYLTSNFDVDVDYYMHLWNEDNIFPMGFSGKRELHNPQDGYYEYIPTENKSLHENVINHLSPKMVIYSNFADTVSKDYYKGNPEYISYVNTLGQFYAFEKLINSCDYSEYDVIIRWRYDLLANHHHFSNNLFTAINQCNLSEKNLFSKDVRMIGGGYGKLGNNDRWFGFTPNAIDDFKNIHKDLFIEIHENSTEAEIYVEEGFLNLLNRMNLTRVSVQFSERIIRKNMSIINNFSLLSKDEQDDELEKFSIWVGPEHANNGYTPT